MEMGHDMARNARIVCHLTEELARLNSETDWAKVDATSQDEVERVAEAEDGPLPEGWESSIILGAPEPKRSKCDTSESR